jgi:hypothetical protein
VIKEVLVHTSFLSVEESNFQDPMGGGKVSPLALVVCHPLVCARLANMVGDATDNLELWEFERFWA